MSNKRTRKKLNRAAPQLSSNPPKYAPGGSLMYVPPSYTQSIMGQTYYGTQLKNEPSSWTSLFSPGVPLPPQPTVNPDGRLVQFRFPIGYNTFPVDRSLGNQDIPSFQVLRNLARMFDGIGLCERFWLDMVPRMTLSIKLKKEYVDEGAEDKDYKKEIKYFRDFFAKPDGQNDLHAWLCKALREQTQVDELYLYKNRTRGGKLLGLQIIDGTQMKPLLDDWGMLPPPPKYAYQQYPWGIPGWQYTTDQIIHFQETPAADTPYGTSRIERIILRVNQALRKEKKDMAHFTEGNIPQSFMEVPESLNWTPDQIDAYEQSWNALLAGNAQQQVRVKFMQPGMKYTSAEQYQLLTDFDMFLYKVTFGVYGVPPSEFGFVEGSALSSSGESQEDVTYRRTVEPLALVYGRLLTKSMNEDFPPDLHGEMFEACFGGYEEVDDENEKATTLTTYTKAGLLGLSAAAKLAGLPEDPEAPAIGRVVITANGPIFLDDVSTPEMRQAQAQATMSGYQMAAKSPAPGKEQPATGEEPPKAGKEPPSKDGQTADNKETLSRVSDVLAGLEEQLRLLRAANVTPEETYEQRAQQNAEVAPGLSGDSRRTDSSNATRAAQSGAGEPGTQGADSKEVSAEYRRWRERAIADVKAGRTQRPFESALISTPVHTWLTDSLDRCESPDQVRAVFDHAREREASFFAPAASASGGSPPPSKSVWKLRW